MAGLRLVLGVEVRCDNADCLWSLATDADGHARVTDAQGRWSLNNVPAGDGIKVSLRVHHDDYISDKYWGGLQNEQEVTLKKIYFEGERVRLQPCNPFMMPFYQSAGNVEVQGRVIGVIRGTDAPRRISGP